MPLDTIDTSKLAALKEIHNTSIASESTESFPLWALLTIYEKAYPAAYTDYMLGMILLKDWLGPIDCGYYGTLSSYPEILSNYQIQKLADILNITEDQIIDTLSHKVRYSI